MLIETLKPAACSNHQGLPPPRDHLQATSAQPARTLVASTGLLAPASRRQALEDVRLGVRAVVPVQLPAPVQLSSSARPGP
jgi:hypothetical protein